MKKKCDHNVSHFDTTRCPVEKILQGPDNKCGMFLILKTMEYAKINVTLKILNGDAVWISSTVDLIFGETNAYKCCYHTCVNCLICPVHMYP